MHQSSGWDGRHSLIRKLLINLQPLFNFLVHTSMIPFDASSSQVIVPPPETVFLSIYNVYLFETPQTIWHNVMSCTHERS